ncbi:MAG TPA: CopD family protein [Thermoleophilaceae bacterium]|nr:CopD family protein [Thermoleophilaceae bacterium]
MVGLAPLALVATLALAPAASAHSTLLETEPARDRVVEHSPKRVVLHFDEPVDTAVGSMAVYDGEGERVDAGEILRPAPESVAVAIDGELERGTYTVAWRVISADSDPINGAWVFHVEAPGAQPSGVAAQVLEDTPFVTSALYLGGRFLDFTLLLACVGGTAALAFALRFASAPVRRRLLTIVAVLAAALVVVSLAELGLQGAAAAGAGIGYGYQWDVVTSVADTRFGHFALARAAIAAALCAAVLVARAHGARASGPAGVVALLLAAGLVVTPGLSGHASVSGPISVVADAAHVQAAGVWTGGLAFVVLGLVLSRGARWELAATSVPRFSTMAVASVALLVVAGTVNGYLQVRAWRGLWETEYGILLLVKIGLVLPLLALGAYNNRYAVPRLRGRIASSLERRRFVRFAGAELVIMLAVVGVTAGLVNAPPARTEVQMHEAPTADLELGPLMAHMEVEPGMLGRNDIHLEFTEGRPEEVRVSAELRAQGIGPLRYRARRGMGPRAWVVRRANLSPAGEWQLRVEARRGEFDLFTDTVPVEIEKEP